METLPWEWYVSPERLRVEQERIFRPAWHYAGPADWVAENGDRFPCRAGDVPLVVVRDSDSTLRAFVNVCRHRGSEVVSERGRSQTLQCPYHAWTYGLDGRLRSAPRSEREESFEPGELGLLRAAVAEWGSFVFVSADAGAPPLERALGPVPELLAQGGVDVGSLVFRERSHYALDANWKIAVENYLECYHCAVAHPGFTRLVDVDPDAYVLEPGEGRWSQYGQARNGDGGCQFHLVWPALKINAYPGVANLSLGPVWPDGPERTQGFLDYFFGPDVSDEAAADLIAFDDQVGREDTALVESVQRGVRSGLIEHGRLLPDSERLVASFQESVRNAAPAQTL
ncbi:MAG TPA: aromatic ring-hydroxylating dioxygenase subunit alpha [Gaiellaceae bacterium]|nr:aromatic ring-hydroxylating dioxygenase subunit alpha [Gaiellaceae bacterium]